MIDTSRRDFIRKAAPLTAATFTIIKPELVRGAGKERLKAGLVGCGARGSQAVVDMMTGTENVDLVAVADLFEDKLETSLRNYSTKPSYEQWKDRIKVAPDMRHTGFDAYKKLLASDIDIVMLATPPGLPARAF